MLASRVQQIGVQCMQFDLECWPAGCSRLGSSVQFGLGSGVQFGLECWSAGLYTAMDTGLKLGKVLASGVGCFQTRTHMCSVWCGSKAHGGEVQIIGLG